MRRVWTVGVAVVLAATIACGKSEAERQAEQAAAEAQKAAEAASKAAEQAGSDLAKGVEGMAKGAEGFAKAMEGMAGALAGAATGGKAVAPVSFRDLQTVLPTVSGWTMAKPRGERMTAPVAFSQTEAQYTNGDQRIEVKVVDSGFHQILIAPWAMFLAAGYEKETEDGYEKSIEIGDNPGFEKWNGERKNGELNLVVAKRFLVSIEGRKVADAKVLHEFASGIDMARLATLK